MMASNTDNKAEGEDHRVGNLEDDASSVAASTMARDVDVETPSASAAGSRPGLELIHDDVGPMPLAAGTGELETAQEGQRVGKKRAAGVEQIDDGHEPFFGAVSSPLDADVFSKKMPKSKKGAARVEQINDDHEPFHGAMTSSLFDDGTLGKKMPAKSQELGAYNEPVGLTPPVPFNQTVADIQSDPQTKKKGMFSNPPGVNGVNVDEEAPPTEDEVATGTTRTEWNIRSRPGNTEGQTEHSNTNGVSGEYGTTPGYQQDGDSLQNISNNDGVSETHHLQRDPSLPGIAEAYPVDDVVIVATHPEPELPWWKQRRAKLLLAAVFVVVAILSVALGVSLSSDAKPITKLIALTTSPSISTEPTLEPTTGHPSMIPTTHPSSSQIPSFAPSACSDQIISTFEQLDLRIPNPDKPKFAIDGRNLVVIAADRGNSLGGDGTFNIVFFTFTENNMWERAGYFIESYNVDFGYEYVDYDVDLSGRTALIGLSIQGSDFYNPDPSKNRRDIYVYQQTNIGLWAKVGSPEPDEDSYICRGGYSVAIHGSLAAMLHEKSVYDCYPVPDGVSAIYVFKRSGPDWVQIFTTEGDTSFQQVMVDSNTIAARPSYGAMHIYYYDENDDSTVRMPLLPPASGITGMVLNENYLICSSAKYWSDYYGVSIYRRMNESEPFTRIQYLNASEYGDNFGRSLALDKGVLVVGSQNNTHFFSEQNNIWEEMLTLERSFDRYQLYGRTLIAADQKDVFSMSIADCTQSIPTQMPSVSIAPTTCYPVKVHFFSNTFDTHSSSWEATIQQYGILESDSAVIKKYANLDSFGNVDFEESTCLLPGRYQFKFQVDSFTISLFELHYSLESNGQVITREKFSVPDQYEADEVTVFDIPFDRTTANSPTGGPFPSSFYPSSSSPTHSPQTTSPSWIAFQQHTNPPTPGDVPSSIHPTSTSPMQPSPTAPVLTSNSFVDRICLTESECKSQQQKKGFSSFYSGDYTDYGCFSRNNNIFWGVGGTEEQMSSSVLSKKKERVWCD